MAEVALFINAFFNSWRHLLEFLRKPLKEIVSLGETDSLVRDNLNDLRHCIYEYIFEVEVDHNLQNEAGSPRTRRKFSEL